MDYALHSNATFKQVVAALRREAFVLARLAHICDNIDCRHGWILLLRSCSDAPLQMATSEH